MYTAPSLTSTSGRHTTTTLTSLIITPHSAQALCRSWRTISTKKPSSPHLYRHDLESFFYVFIFVVCSHDFVTDEQGRRRLHRNEKKGIVEWLRHDNDRLQGEKLLMFLMKPKFRRTVKAKEWDEDFKVLTACLVSMYNSFRESSLSGTDGASSDSGDETDKTGGEEDETRSPFRHVSYDLFVKAKAKLPFSIL